MNSAPPAAQAPPDLAAPFFTMSTDMLCVAGVDGYFKAVNPSWSRTLGYSSEELLAEPYLDFVHPEDVATTIAEAGKLADGFETIHFRNRYRCKDGSYKWLAWTATPAMLDGTIYATARDVTTAVQADHDREERLRHFSEQEARIRAILAGNGLRVVFQPVVALRTRNTRGFEALSRFDHPHHQPPDAWFADADDVGLGSQLEMRAIREAVVAAADMPEAVFLSVNASPSTLVSEEVAQVLDRFDGERVVVEVTEHAAVADYALLQEPIARLRQRGVRLAIDDAGAGHSGLNQIVRLVPEFIKLDLFLIRDIDTDAVKRALVTALVAFAQEIGAALIAEGVETASEFAALKKLGVDHAQGYFLGRPAPLSRRSS